MNDLPFDYGPEYHEFSDSPFGSPDFLPEPEYEELDDFDFPEIPPSSICGPAGLGFYTVTQAEHLPEGYNWHCWGLDCLCLISPDGNTSLYESSLNDSFFRFSDGLCSEDMDNYSMPSKTDVEYYVLDNGLILDVPVKGWLDKFSGCFHDFRPGFDIADSVTFLDIFNCISDGGNLFSLIPDDVSLREDIFSEIAARKGIEYGAVYDIWESSSPASADMAYYSNFINKHRGALSCAEPTPAFPRPGRDR